jgi:hypothetical protein
MFQASVEGSEASKSRSHLIASRVFVYMALVVSGVPQASFWSAAVGQFAEVEILEVCMFITVGPMKKLLEVMSLVEEGLLCILKMRGHCGLGQLAWPPRYPLAHELEDLAPGGQQPEKTRKPEKGLCTAHEPLHELDQRSLTKV